MGRLSTSIAIETPRRQSLEELGRRTELLQISDRDATALGQASPVELNVVLESAMKEPPNPLMVHVAGGLALSGRAQAMEVGAYDAAAGFAAVYAGAMSGQLLDVQN
jgi:hypothetical protein